MAVAKKKQHSSYSRGYAAFSAQQLPSTCEYLNEDGDNSVEIVAWMKGWSDAFEDSFSNWQKEKEK